MMPRANHLPHGLVDYQRVGVRNMAGEINLMPPSSPQIVNAFIFDVLRISAVEGELLEGLSRQCEAAKWDLRAIAAS